MIENPTSIERRTVFLSGAAGMLALAAATFPSGRASAMESSAVEKANTDVVRDFCKAWGDDPPDLDKLASDFLSEDCTIRFGETIAPVTGQAAAAELFKSFFTNGERYDLKIVDTFARGPIVMNARVDSTIKGKRVTNPTQVVGVFLVRDGKIKEWSDYV
jgi:limonene-1,2-epoxide hydrolase